MYRDKHCARDNPERITLVSSAKLMLSLDTRPVIQTLNFYNFYGENGLILELKKKKERKKNHQGSKNKYHWSWKLERRKTFEAK